MAATRRLQKELGDIRHSGLKSFRDIQVDESNILTWQGLIVPDNPPYNKGAFKIEINFPAEYPFKPPKINFKTKIYHPNIDEKGQVCLPIIAAENWKPATRTDQVIQALVALVNEPEPEHPLRADLAEEYLKDKKKFAKNAEEFTKKHIIQTLIAMVQDPDPDTPIRLDVNEEFIKDRKKFMKNAEEYTIRHALARPEEITSVVSTKRKRAKKNA